MSASIAATSQHSLLGLAASPQQVLSLRLLMLAAHIANPCSGDQNMLMYVHVDQGFEAVGSN